MPRAIKTGVLRSGRAVGLFESWLLSRVDCAATTVSEHLADDDRACLRNVMLGRRSCEGLPRSVGIADMREKSKLRYRLVIYEGHGYLDIEIAWLEFCMLHLGVLCPRTWSTVEVVSMAYFGCFRGTGFGRYHRVSGVRGSAFDINDEEGRFGDGHGGMRWVR